MKVPTVILKEGREVSAKRGHPWIFSGAIKRFEGEKVAGIVVRLISSSGEMLGRGYLSDEGSIAVKMLSFGDEDIDESFWQNRVRSALRLRSSLGLGSSERTSAYRLINAEGDGLPGLIVDIYNKLAVIQCQSLGMSLQKNAICVALRAELGTMLEGIYDRSHSFVHLAGDKKASETDGSGFLWGGCETRVFLENGYQFEVDWEKGQKTGFFLDQRNNRALVGQFAAGRTVLNAFCYTGGFSVYALGGGAKEVESIDSSKSAIAGVKRNIALNFPDSRHQEVDDDFLRYMQQMNDRFDMIILDPPAFAKQRSAVPGALRGYRSINTNALQAIRPGGLLFTFSCSQLVGTEDFRRVLLEASLQAKRKVRVLAELHQAPCHPVSIFHPEGNYLKGLMLAVE